MDADPLVKVGRAAVTAFHADHRREDAPGLQGHEADTVPVEEFHASLLHPADIVRVVDDRHLVGLVVLDAVDIVIHIRILQSVAYRPLR